LAAGAEDRLKRVKEFLRCRTSGTSIPARRSRPRLRRPVADGKEKGLPLPEGLKNGAGDEIRTHDIHLGKVALYH
jgi:hypothetical protein